MRCPGARPRKELAQPSIGRNILIYIVLKYIYTIFETGRHDVLVQLLALSSRLRALSYGFIDVTHKLQTCGVTNMRPKQGKQKL